MDCTVNTVNTVNSYNMEELMKNVFYHKGVLYTLEKNPGELDKHFLRRGYQVVQHQPKNKKEIQTIMNTIFLEESKKQGCAY